VKKKRQTIPVVILRTNTGYNAFSPIVDGCVATAKTVDTALKRIGEALQYHLEGEMLMKNRRKRTETVLKETFDDYGTDAVYASIHVGPT
jgi:predicted RNase H-like HicB family nuclease